MTARPAVTPLLWLALLTGCESSPAEPAAPTGPIRLAVVSGDGQRAAPGEELPEPLVVRALDARGRAVRQQVVSFVITAGGGSVWAGAALTDPQGYARERWRLGPEAGDNRLEGRMVDQDTGEGLLLHTFTATGVPVAPESCNGVDDDLDGTTDEDLPYCFAGAPAPNTDGGGCLVGWLDHDGDAANGCEALADVLGDYALEPAVELRCEVPGLPAQSALLREVMVFQHVPGGLRIGMPMEFDPFVFPLELTLPYDAATATFAGSGTLTDQAEASGLTLAAVATFDVSGAFTAPGRLEAHIRATLSLTYTLSGVTSSTTCTPADVQVVGTR